MAVTANTLKQNDTSSPYHEHFSRTRDSLTGLHNKFAFKERVDHFIKLNNRYSNEFSILIIGIDAPNIDSILPSSDTLSIELAKRLRSSVRSTDTIARVGEHLYAVLLPMINSPRFVAKIVSNTVSALSAPFFLADEQYFVDLHVGIGLYPQDGIAFDDLFERAERAMNRAHASSSEIKYQFYSESINGKVLSELSCESQLMRYIEKQQFQILFQPVISSINSQVAYVDVSVDWPETSLQGLNFAQCINILDGIDLNALFYEKLLTRICTCISEWEADEKEISPLLISLSGAQFRDHNLAQKLNQIIGSRDIDKSLIIFSTHERNIIRDMQWAVPQIRRINDLGFRFAVDHFWHSLTYLNELKTLDIELLIFSPEIAESLEEGIEYYGVIQGATTITKSFGIQTLITCLDSELVYNLAENIDVDYRQGTMLFDVIDESLLIKNVLT